MFTRPLFTIIFRPKFVVLDTDSISRVKTVYESVKEDVLILITNYRIVLKRNHIAENLDTTF